MSDLKANLTITAKDEASSRLKRIANEVKAVGAATEQASRAATSTARVSAAEQQRLMTERVNAAKTAAAAQGTEWANVQASARRVAEHGMALRAARVRSERRAAEQTIAAAKSSREAVVKSFDAIRSRSSAIATSFGDVRRGVSGIASGLLSVGKAALLGTGGALAIGYAFKRSFIDTAAQFEMFRVQLNGLEGSSSKGAKAMAWVKQFAKDSPGEIDGVMEAFVRLRAFGLNPMDGTMQAIVDTSARLGFSQDRMMGISLALGQAWTRTKLQGQDILQLVERGVPVWDLLAKATGKSIPQLQGLSEAGQLGRREMKLLIAEMGKSARGAGAAQMSTWAGIVEKLSDTWTQFKLAVMDAGVFDRLKTRLTQLFTKIDELTKSGEFKAFAEDVAKQMHRVMDAVEEVGGEIWRNRQRIMDSIGDTVKTVRSVVDAFGGWRNAAIAVGVVMNAQTIVATGRLVTSTAQLGIEVVKLIPRLLAYAAAQRAVNAAAGTGNLPLPGGGAAGGAASTAGGGVASLAKKGAAGALPFLTNPLTVVGALGVGAAAYGAYQMNEADQAERATAGSADRRRARFEAGNAALKSRYGGQQRVAAAQQRQEVGGTIKIQVDDRRVRVTQVRSVGGIELAPEGGLNLAGAG